MVLRKDAKVAKTFLSTKRSTVAFYLLLDAFE